MNDDRIFYGPHPCAFCGKKIVKASRTQGGEEFDAPDEPIYPNSEWVRHNCGPRTVDGDAIAVAILNATSKLNAMKPGESPEMAAPWGLPSCLTSTP